MVNLNDFEVGFRDSVLQLMLVDLKFMREYYERLKPDIFTDEVRWQLASYIQSFYEGFHSVPRNLILQYIRERGREDHHSKDKTEVLLLAARRLLKKEMPPIGFVTKRLDEFFTYSELARVRLELDQAMDANDVPKAKKILLRGTRQMNKPQRPVDFFATSRQRSVRREVDSTREHSGLRFMIPTLDLHKVYAHRQDVSIWIGPSKRGKSIALMHCGKAAVLQGHQVLHVGLDNPLKMMEDRYDTLFSGLPVNELRVLSDRLGKRVASVRDLFEGRLHLLWYPSREYSPLDLKADVEQLRNDGVRVDTVIVDYAELMRPIGKYSGESAPRLNRDDIFLNLRSVAAQLDLVCVTAWQTPMKKESKYRLGMADGQESSNPAQHAALVITLNQTEQEKEAQQMRLWVAGYWHGVSGPLIGNVLVRTDFDRMQLCARELDWSEGVEYGKEKNGE